MLNLCRRRDRGGKCKGDAAEGYHPVCTSAARKTGDTAAASARANPCMRQGRRPLGLGVQLLPLRLMNGCSGLRRISTLLMLVGRIRTASATVVSTPKSGSLSSPHGDTAPVTARISAAPFAPSGEQAP
jgi:hypothetical protein